MDEVTNNIIVLAAAASLFVKLLVDLVRIATEPPRWVSPLLAAIGGPVVVLLLMLAGGMVLDQRAIANAVLAGLMAAGSAVGVTELQKHASPSQNTEPSRQESRDVLGIHGPR